MLSSSQFHLSVSVSFCAFPIAGNSSRVMLCMCVCPSVCSVTELTTVPNSTVTYCTNLHPHHTDQHSLVKMRTINHVLLPKIAWQRGCPNHKCSAGEHYNEIPQNVKILYRL